MAEEASELARWACRVVSGGATLLAFALAARALTARAELAQAPVTDAAPNVLRVDRLSALRERRDCPTVMLLGGSQTRVATALARGETGSEDARGTVIDALAARVERDDLCFMRFTMNALGPAEMLVSVAAAVEQRGAPKLVIAALMWDTLSYDLTLRDEVADAFADDDFKPKFFADLRRESASPALLAYLGEVAVAARTRRLHVASVTLGERLDAWVTPRAAELIPFLGNTRVQASLRRETFERFLAAVAGRGPGATVHAVIPSHLALNVDAMIALAAYLHDHGTPLLVYDVPVRTDVPSFSSHEGEAAIMTRLADAFAAQGATLVDLRSAVPNELWGYSGETPERVHFSLPGHALVAAELANAARDHRLLAPKDAP